MVSYRHLERERPGNAVRGGLTGRTARRPSDGASALHDGTRHRSTFDLSNRINRRRVREPHTGRVDRAYSLLHIKSVDAVRRVFTGIATDPGTGSDGLTRTVRAVE